MIPQIINYCWFGGNPKPKIVLQCIESWKKIHPDWEIREWNESNWDISKYQYAKEAYELKYWAFVADVAKLDIALQHGGVFMDTDVELLAPIDDLVKNNAFFFFETGRNINQGVGFGAKKSSEVISKMLDRYKERNFIVAGNPYLLACPVINTEGLLLFDPQFKRNNRTQTLKDNVTIYSTFDYGKYMVHHCTGLWHDDSHRTAFKSNTKTRIFKPGKVKAFLRKPEIFDWIEKCLGKKSCRIYTFFVYDVMEYGIIHYLKKIMKAK